MAVCRTAVHPQTGKTAESKRFSSLTRHPPAKSPPWLRRIGHDIGGSGAGSPDSLKKTMTVIAPSPGEPTRIHAKIEPISTKAARNGGCG
jgi:hypothetical protein